MNLERMWPMGPGYPGISYETLAEFVRAMRANGVVEFKVISRDGKPDAFGFPARSRLELQFVGDGGIVVGMHVDEEQFYSGFMSMADQPESNRPECNPCPTPEEGATGAGWECACCQEVYYGFEKQHRFQQMSPICEACYDNACELPA